MPKIEIHDAPVGGGSSYPAPFDAPCRGQTWRKLGDAAQLTQFGVHLVRVPPGEWSSQRHWHSAEDEFVWIVEGEATLVSDEGEALLRAGECAGFRAGDANGHHFQNRSQADLVFLVVGTRAPSADVCHYPDVDLAWSPERLYHHRDGTPYPVNR